MQNKIHILITGVNVYGNMASSQRIKNLISPLLELKKINISNMVINKQPESYDLFPYDVNLINIKYKLSNPISIIKYIFKSYKFIKLNKIKNNILYCYGYPEIENIWFLIIAKLVNYKIIFDIVENNKYINSNNKSIKNRIKLYSEQKMLKLIPVLGNICFTISYNLYNYCKIICKDKIPVIHLPISVDNQYIIKFKKTTKLLDGKINIFYGGSFGYKDNIPQLIKAFENACEKNTNLELILTGKLSNDNKLEIYNLINNSIKKHKIKYKGCLPIDEYYMTMVNSEILCVVRENTNFANAGFPYKLGEYLASGNAIIATKVCDIDKYLKNNYNAILIEPGSIQQLSKAILLLSENEKLRNKISANAQKISNKYFDSNKISKIFYENLIKII